MRRARLSGEGTQSSPPGCGRRASEHPPRHCGGDRDRRRRRRARQDDGSGRIPRHADLRRAGRRPAHLQGSAGAPGAGAARRPLAGDPDADGCPPALRTERRVVGAGHRQVLRGDGVRRGESGVAGDGAVLRGGRAHAVRQRTDARERGTRREAAACARRGDRLERRRRGPGVRRRGRPAGSLRRRAKRPIRKVGSAHVRGSRGGPHPDHPARDRGRHGVGHDGPPYAASRPTCSSTNRV